MHKLTLFGEFVIGLKEHISSGRRGSALNRGALVYEITGQDDASQASRYLRMFKGEAELYWYHKSTIAQIIAHSYVSNGLEPQLVNRIGARGYQFVGKGNDELSVDVLGAAIDSARGPMLDSALAARPLRPDSEFCKRMCELYGESYGGLGGRSSDLQHYIQSIDGDCDDLTRSREIYKRILLAILLGPKAMRPIASRSNTAKMAGRDSIGAVDGFSLTQMSVFKGQILPTNTSNYNMGRDVLIGLPGNSKAMYFPEFGEGVDPHVSHSHAIVSCVQGENGSPACTLVNLSTSNGTAVLHSDGTVWFSGTKGASELLQSGDEIWLAPIKVDGKVYPEYEKGAVLRFDCLYEYAYEVSGAIMDGTAAPSVEPASPTGSTTPVYKGGSKGKRALKEVIGFELRNLTGSHERSVYRYEDLKDDDDYFDLTVGRQGQFETGVCYDPTVSRLHAHIEHFQDNWKVVLTNTSENTIVVRNVGGTFDELNEWQDATLEDGDEIYLAGSVGESGPFADARGSIISFRYIYRAEQE